MNICLFSDSFLPNVGGMEYVIHNLGNALADQGHDVTVIVKKLSWKSPKVPRKYRLKRYSLPIKGTGKLGVDHITSIIRFAALHMRQNFDVLHCHGVSYAGSRARRIASIFHLPLVLTPHGADIQKVPSLGYGLRLNDRWDRVITKNLLSADYVTAISNSVRQELGVVLEDRVEDVPNGIDAHRFHGPRSNYLSETLRIAPHKKIVLSIGRNRTVKGYRFGIEAVSDLVRRLRSKDVHYVIVGRGVAQLHDVVDALAASSFVSLIDEAKPELITECYKSADVFFSPSIIEGLSLVSIEAIAAGLPLVVTNVAGNRDVAEENCCGIVVESENNQDMAEGLLSILSDENLRLRLAEAAEASAMRYDWSEIAKKYLCVYKKAIDSRQPRS